MTEEIRNDKNYTILHCTFEIVVRSGGYWQNDTIGVNEPRTYDECEADIESLRSGACGDTPDWIDAEYGIRNTETGEISHV